MADPRTSLPEAQAPLLSTAHVISSSAPLRDNRGWRKGLQTELLHGQGFNIYGEGRGWVFGQSIPLVAGSERPGYVGYIPKKSISGDVFEASHAVSALRAPVFNDPDIKSHITQSLPLNAQVQSRKEEGDFVKVGVGAYIHNRHLLKLSSLPSGQDYVNYAEMYLGAPYIWGGTGDMGLDCSGLLQMALCAVGQDAPRDADLQEQDLGDRLKTTGETDELRRGDLIFWPGHVGIMSDAQTLLHANAFHMVTAKEPYSEAVERIGTPRTIKRF